MGTISPTKFKRDNHFRAQIFDQGSFTHQGKANLNLLLALLKHIPTGGIVLDPMAGTGSALVYTDLGYPVICGELEPHWAHLCESNRKTITGRRLFAASTPALCNQWDAARMPLADHSIAAIVTSPPYWDMLSDWHIKSNNLQADGHPDYGIAYGIHPANVGNIHIYEHYLRAMFAIYRECWRVLRPGGKLALIVKDRIHKASRVTIARDTYTLAAALGFRPVDYLNRRVTPSLHRHVLHQKHPEIPQVNTEQVLIFEKPGLEEQNHPPRPMKAAFILGPKPNNAPSWQLFTKSLRYSNQVAKRAFILTSTGLKSHFNGLEIDQLQVPSHKGYRQRKEYIFDCLHDIVVKHGFGSGSEIELHCPMDYGRYVTLRGQTLGMSITNPTEGLNGGSKLKWYTEKLQNDTFHF